jgi:hypothetical protein
VWDAGWSFVLPTFQHFAHNPEPFQPCIGKGVPVHAMKTYEGSRGTAPLILNLRISRRWVVTYTPRSLYPPGKETGYPLNRWMIGPQGWYRRLGEWLTSSQVSCFLEIVC